MRPKKLILIAMADEYELSNMRFMLNTQRYRVIAAGNGEAAVDLFGASAVDLVLIDFYLPSTNGDQVAKRMKELKPYIPIVMLRDRRPLGMDVFAADALLDKTRTPTMELLERIKVMIARKRGPRKGSPSAMICGRNGLGKKPAQPENAIASEIVA
jgi:two-component system, OmpR family, response regulator CpxR